MSRKFFVGGNWKMNGSKDEIAQIVAGLKGETADHLDPSVGKFDLIKMFISCNLTISLFTSKQRLSSAVQHSTYPTPFNWLNHPN